MEQAIRKSFFPGWGRLPNWLTILLNILLALTLIYAIVKISLALLELIRKFFYWFFEKRTFYVMIVAIIAGSLAALFITQKAGVPLAQNIIDWFTSQVNEIKNALGDKIIELF